ncbi:PREDICTED: transient receptor potential cation channel subfamily A member 1 homolog [Amphimedon queenslandica]|uniref:Ion transport domain-containing protein n=1 Tax=Amphimedon queenslandica TaxID=400682 RepID=A0A1X7UGK0_AMPQE|nr:PREDICTED: transient receptor potential cation channel subfamily A member 1 homolog [Amphimedon queenslandica]|eukprot:XP_019854432.1 PREDICTED: transient receptor potential cation channel subfamily A member 1 homolog [Amphimedon queenslandica]
MTDKAASAVKIEPQCGGGSKDNTDESGRTQLHRACKDGNSDEVDELLQNEGVDINATDKDGCTPLHYACKAGNEGIVKRLIEKGADWSKISNDGRTSLHYACKAGNEGTVKHLIDKGADWSKISNDKRTSLHYACEGGNERIVRLLLTCGAEVTKCDRYQRNPLEVAVEEGKKNAAMAIVNSKNHWEKALCNYTAPSTVRRTLCCCNKGKKKPNDAETSDASDECCNGKEKSKDSEASNKKDASKKRDTYAITQFTTPMRRIIEKMPDVAKVVFDKCCETEGSPYDDEYKITYNYEFLVDFELENKNRDRSEGIQLTCNCFQRGKNSCDSADKTQKQWPPPSEYHSSQNHCLTILANSQNSDLLKHPLVRTLLDQKWNKYGWQLYYTNLYFYFLFVILLTSFALTLQLHSLSTSHIEVTENETSTEGLHSVSQGYISFASVCLIVYSTIMMLREAFQLVLLGQEYLTSFVNYIEVPLFMLTIVFAFVCSNECYGSYSWQWQTGVIAVFLSWIVLILSIRKLPVIGIYVVMFLRICYNFMKVIVLALLLILAFAVPFYMVFYDKSTPFITPWRTMVIILIMATGELDMESLLQHDSSHKMDWIQNNIQYPVVAFSLLVVFVILMPILFLNLLISLAVDDTQKIQKSADTYRLTLKIEFVVYIEAFLRSIRSLVPRCLSTMIKKFLLKCKCKSCNKKNNDDKKKKEEKLHHQIIIYPNHAKSVREQMICWLEGRLNEIKRYFKTEPQTTVAEIKNQLSEEMKDLRSSVSEEVKDLHKDLYSSMDRLLDIVKSIKNERQGGGGVEETGRRKEEDEEHN